MWYWTSWGVEHHKTNSWKKVLFHFSNCLKLITRVPENDLAQAYVTYTMWHSTFRMNIHSMNIPLSIKWHLFLDNSGLYATSIPKYTLQHNHRNKPFIEQVIVLIIKDKKLKFRFSCEKHKLLMHRMVWISRVVL